MNSLYEALEKAENLESRRHIVREFLDKADITDIFKNNAGDLITGPLKGEKILPKMTTPGYADNCFVVGKKYCIDEPYADGPSGHNHNQPAYVLAVVWGSGEELLLTIKPDSRIPWLTKKDRLLSHTVPADVHK